MLNKEKQKMITKNINNKQPIDDLADNYFKYQEETYKRIDCLFYELQGKFEEVADAFKLQNRPPFNGGGNRLESYFQNKLYNDFGLRKRIHLKKIITSFISGFVSSLIISKGLAGLSFIWRAIFIIVGGLGLFALYYISLGSDAD
jgi:hypothetical protein